MKPQSMKIGSSRVSNLSMDGFMITYALMGILCWGSDTG